MNCQEYVTFATDSEVLYSQEKLPFTCTPTTAAKTATSTITDLILWKNSSGWNQIVRVRLHVDQNGQSQNIINWIDNDMKSHATFEDDMLKVVPKSQALLKFEIMPDKVKCSYSGEYKCSLSGISDVPDYGGESAHKTVRMRGKQKL